ncbi:MAG: PTS sugar transporter subunit IIA [Chlamydiota bacterium]
MVILDQISHQKRRKWFRREDTPSISSYLSEESITFLQAKTRDDALEQLVYTLKKAGKIQDAPAFHELILKREQIVSTDIGLNAALPHAKSADFSEFFIALGVQKEEEGIRWKSPHHHASDHHSAVRLVFMIGGPENQPKEYLDLLSNLTRILKDEDLRKSLLSIDTISALYRQISLY